MLQKSSIEKTAGVFFQSPTKPHYLMDISRITEIAHTSIKENLNTLLKAGLIIETIEKKGKRKFPLYTANKDSSEFRKEKAIYNFKQLQESGVIEHIGDHLAPKSMSVFGSYRRGEDIETSDIDMFVECKKEQIELKKFEKILGRKIQLHFKESLLEYPKELRNNILNGIALYGYVEAYQ